MTDRDIFHYFQSDILVSTIMHGYRIVRIILFVLINLGKSNYNQDYVQRKCETKNGRKMGNKLIALCFQNYKGSGTVCKVNV